MTAVVFEHVRLSDLPAAWRAKLPTTGFSRSAQVTVRIEQEVVPTEQEQAALKTLMENPMVNMWANREDMADLATYVRAVRAPRLTVDGTQRKKAG